MRGWGVQGDDWNGEGGAVGCGDGGGGARSAVQADAGVVEDVGARGCVGAAWESCHFCFRY